MDVGGRATQGAVAEDEEVAMLSVTERTETKRVEKARDEIMPMPTRKYGNLIPAAADGLHSYKTKV